MLQENIYEICEQMGLNENDIDKILDENTNQKQHTYVDNPIDGYKDPLPGRYGTISIKDF